MLCYEPKAAPALQLSKVDVMLLIERAFIVTYLLSIPHLAELNEERVRVRLGQKGCGWNRVKELERKER